jgi:selenocysteine-specific elongation factor
MTSSPAAFSPATRFFTVSTAGHVDHGKTSLIRALTGIDPDRLKEEKERQMTTDLGFAYLELPGDLIVGFVDVPGHGKFLKNMLAGVGGIDMALLVVAADEGAMPQTRQHVRILSLLGVSRAVVAMTKIDMVDDSEQIEIVAQEVGELLSQHGIELLELVPLSATKGTGIDQLKSAIEKRLRALPPRGTSGGAFLPVDRVFSKTGFGTVITGTLVRGKLAVGDQVMVGPDVSSARVRRLETHGHQVDVALPGQRVACNLVLKENKDISRGHVILGNEVPASRLLIVTLYDRPRLLKQPLSEKVSDQPVRFYHGTAEYHGYVRWCDNLAVADDHEHRAVAFVALNEPAVAQAEDRFVIRMSDETIFGGEVIFRDKPRWLNRADIAVLTGLLQQGDREGAAIEFVQRAPHKTIKDSQFNLFLPHPASAEVEAKLIAQGKIEKLADTLMLPETRRSLSKQVVDVVGKILLQQHQSGDSSDAVPLESVRVHLNPKLDRPAFQAFMESEAATGAIVRKSDRVGLGGPKPAAGAEAKYTELLGKIESVLDQHLCLELDELARQCSVDLIKMKHAAQALAKCGRIHLINYEFVITDANLHKAHEVLARVWHEKKNIAPTDFREAMNTSRKYAMALLQHFDDNKITRRLPTGRVLLKAPRN